MSGSEPTPEIHYSRMMTREITPEIQYIRTVRRQITPEIRYIRMVPHEITPEIQYIRMVTREITPEIQYIRMVRHESTPEIEYIWTVTREIEYMYTVEGGSHACDPLDYPPWTSDMDSEKKKRVCTKPFINAKCKTSRFPPDGSPHPWGQCSGQPDGQN
jgi:hypothetical protein